MSNYVRNILEYWNKLGLDNGENVKDKIWSAS